MSTIQIPEDLAGELDKLAGSQDRSSYATGMLWESIQRLRQLEALTMTEGAWKKENHPELAIGSAAYVQQLRSEFDERFEATMVDGK